MSPLQDEGGFVADAASVSARMLVEAIGHVAYGEFHYDSPGRDLYGPATDSSDVVQEQAQIGTAAPAQARSSPHQLREARSMPGTKIAFSGVRGIASVLIRFTESVRVRLWGRALHSFRKGEIHRVPIAVAAVLLAQRCAELIPDPPALPHEIRQAA